MMFYNELFNNINKSNNFLVVPSAIKQDMIEMKTKYELKEKKLFTFKVISTDQLVEILSFSVDEEIYLNNLENNDIFPSITKELINFSRYDLFNQNEELKYFKEKNKAFINIHKTFLDNLEEYSFHIIGPTYLIEPFLNKYPLKIIKINPFKKFETNPSIFLKFKNKEDEVFFIMEKISELLKNKIDINNIFISNYKESDYTLFNKLSSFYNIPMIFNHQIPLISIPYINKIMNLDYDKIIELLENKEELINNFKEDYLINEDQFNQNINTLISIFNKYPHKKYKKNTAFRIILDEVKTKVIKTNNYKDGIRFIKTDQILTLDKNSHVFIINASYESFPHLSKDSDYLSDSEKEIINYPTSTMMNLEENAYLKTIVSSPSIKQVSFSLKDLESEYAPSDLFSLNEIDKKNVISINMDLLTKGYAKDYYKSYFTNKKEGVLQTTFDPSFKMENEEKMIVSKYIKEKNLKLSPTDITTYIQAPFVYYLEKVIGLNTFDESVSLHLGNFFHMITEVLLLVFFEHKVDRSKDNTMTKFSKNENIHKMIFDFILSLDSEDKSDFDYEKFFDDFYNIYFTEELQKTRTLDVKNLTKQDKLTIRTLFYIKKHKDVILKALKVLIELEESVESEELIIEKPIEIQNFKGKADLIKLYKDKTYSIIDYKTGSRESFNVDKIDELLDQLITFDPNQEISFKSLSLLQLVLYSYILSKAYSDYKLKDLSYYSYFEDKLNGITTRKFESSHFTSGKNRIIEDELKLTAINEKIETVLNQTIENINDLSFSTTLRKDVKSKESLDQSYYSIYEALMFFSEEGDINDEED